MNKPKYKVGDTVWWNAGVKYNIFPVSGVVLKRNKWVENPPKPSYFQFFLKRPKPALLDVIFEYIIQTEDPKEIRRIHEQHLHPTKEALIEAL